MGRVGTLVTPHCPACQKPYHRGFFQDVWLMCECGQRYFASPGQPSEFVDSIRHAWVKRADPNVAPVEGVPRQPKPYNGEAHEFAPSRGRNPKDLLDKKCAICDKRKREH